MERECVEENEEKKNGSERQKEKTDGEEIRE